MAIVMGLLVGVTAAASRDVALATGQPASTPWHDMVRRLVPPVLFLVVMGSFVRTFTPLLLGFPIGVAVAIGRRSTLPIVRWTCSVSVEFFRGSPLIVLPFIGWLVLPFLCPPEWENITRVSRAVIIFMLFASAYVAEIVCGGLQSIPRGQSRRRRHSGCHPGSRRA